MTRKTIRQQKIFHCHNHERDDESHFYRRQHHDHHHDQLTIIVILMIQAFLSYDCEGALLTDSLTGQVVAGDGDVYLLRSLSSSFSCDVIEDDDADVVEDGADEDDKTMM